MLSILSGILGFATSGLPSVLKFFEQKGDNAHEEAMAKLEMERALAMAEKGLHLKKRLKSLKLTKLKWKHMQKKELRYTNMMKNMRKNASTWVVNLRASVRPIITYIFVSIFLFADIAGLWWAINTGVDFETAMNIVISTEEMAIISSIIGFWFGSRHWDK